MWFRVPWIVIKLVATMAVGALAITSGVLALRPAARELDAIGHLEFGATINLRPLAERSLMYDRYGGLMGVLHAEQNRAQVTLADVPPHVVDTILAIEDWEFYEHDGVDVRSTVRALLENLESGGVTQGGSTITMQVIKLSLLSPEQSLERKVREAILAMRLEEQMTKEQILERYLNMVYFGNGAYGLQAAAELYFQTNVQSLTWGQAALLAGLIRDPIDYDPFKHPEIAAERRQVALSRLVEVGRLTEADVAVISTEPLPVIPAVPPLPQPLDYFPEDVKQQLLHDPRFNLGDTPSERYNSVFYGGLRIHTTYDPVAQAAAIQARADVLPGGEPDDVLLELQRRAVRGHGDGRQRRTPDRRGAHAGGRPRLRALPIQHRQ